MYNLADIDWTYLSIFLWLHKMSRIYKPYDLEFNHATICVMNVYSEVPNALNVL